MKIRSEKFWLSGRVEPLVFLIRVAICKKETKQEWINRKSASRFHLQLVRDSSMNRLEICLLLSFHLFFLFFVVEMGTFLRSRRNEREKKKTIAITVVYFYILMYT